MPSINYDLRYLSAGLSILEDYLLSKELYWPIGITAPASETPYPQLTLGGLLLARARLSSRQLDAAVDRELTRLTTRMDTLREQWRTAWGNKAHKEFHARFNLWRDFIEDYRDKPHAHFDRYAFEVIRRVQLDLLKSEVKQLSTADLEALEGLDYLLRTLLVRGDFIWEADYQPGFPSPTFWYLYGSLPC